MKMIVDAVQRPIVLTSFFSLWFWIQCMCPKASLMLYSPAYSDLLYIFFSRDTQKEKKRKKKREIEANEKAIKRIHIPFPFIWASYCHNTWRDSFPIVVFFFFIRCDADISRWEEVIIIYICTIDVGMSVYLLYHLLSFNIDFLSFIFRFFAVSYDNNVKITEVIFIVFLLI